MWSFDLYLESTDESAVDARALLAALAEIPHLHETPGDPCRFIYRNPDTSVQLSILLDRSMAAPLREAPEEGDEDVRPPVNILPDEEDTGEEEEDEEDEEEGDEDDDEEGDEEDGEDEVSAAVDLPPVTLSAPLFRPTFFLSELREVADHLRARVATRLVDPHREDGPVDGWPEEEIVASWRRQHEEMASRLRNPGALTRWSPEKSRDFFAYGKLRPRLEEELGDADVDVPVIQPAFLEGEVRTLCVWDARRSVVLPRVDLVLLREPRERRGLFRSRLVLEERLVPCERVWNVLVPFAEYRDDPVAHLIYRRPAEPQPQVSAGLEALEGRKAEEARRADLAGVIDFEISALRERRK